jgi:hypothetical protein
MHASMNNKSKKEKKKRQEQEKIIYMVKPQCRETSIEVSLLFLEQTLHSSKQREHSTISII